MRQTLAILVDAYRELNSKKLFWISLCISVAVIVLLALPVQTASGIGIFGAKLEAAPFMLLGSRAISAGAFYKFIYSWLGINMWLGWGATILALISTASMVPDLISSGAIELTLAKPIGRFRLFLTKYCAGLAFVGLQAAAFAVGTILVIGFRAGEWDARPLLVVPIMVGLFSFLHCISVLVGMATRSTLMSLIAVLIFMLAFSALGQVESVFLQQKVMSEKRVARIQEQQRSITTAIGLVDTQIQRAPKRVDPPAGTEAGGGKPAEPEAEAAAASPAHPRGGRRETNRLLSAGQRMIEAATDTDPDSLRVRRASMDGQLAELEGRLVEESASLATISQWHRWLYRVFTCFPKTGETKGLFQRWVIDKSDWQGFLKMLDQLNGGDSAAQEAMNNRPLWWILGTSFGFEFVVLGLTAWIFVRRDF